MADLVTRATELWAGEAHAQRSDGAHCAWRSASDSAAYDALESALRTQQLRHAVRRARRMKVAMQLTAQEEEQHPGTSSRHRHDGLREHVAAASAMDAQKLTLLREIAARQGFLRQQLMRRSLSPLHRWYCELQLILVAEAQDSVQAMPEAEQEHDSEARLAIALAALNKALARDRKCVDICYAAGSQVHDVLHDLVDDEDYNQWRQQQGAAHTAVAEILSFSTLKAGIACRITCVHFADGTYAFRSSAYIRDLATQANIALLDRRDPVDALIRFVWAPLETTN